MGDEKEGEGGAEMKNNMKRELPPHLHSSTRRKNIISFWFGFNFFQLNMVFP